MSLYSRISAAVALFLFCMASWPAWADSLQAVVLERQGDRVTINKGADEGVQVGIPADLSNPRVTWVLMPTPGARKRKRPLRGVSVFWRRGWDSNPRTPVKM